MVTDTGRPDTLPVSVFTVLKIKFWSLVKSVERVTEKFPVHQILGMQYNHSRYTMHRGSCQIKIITYPNHIRIRKLIIKQRISISTVAIIRRP